jgi:hypothetical protein
MIRLFVFINRVSVGICILNPDKVPAALASHNDSFWESWYKSTGKAQLKFIEVG